MCSQKSTEDKKECKETYTYNQLLIMVEDLKIDLESVKDAFRNANTQLNVLTEYETQYKQLYEKSQDELAELLAKYAELDATLIEKCTELDKLDKENKRSQLVIKGLRDEISDMEEENAKYVEAYELVQDLIEKYGKGKTNED